MHRVLATAYDVNPYKGSESGTGWNFALQLARYHKVTLVTRRNNQAAIDKFIGENGIIDNLSFHYYDMAPWVLWLKKKLRGHFIYFNLWQLFIALHMFRHRALFDVSHMINFHADHVPHFLWLLGRPVVWGPINHNEPAPTFIASHLREKIIDKLIFGIKVFRWNFDPFLRLSVKLSTQIIGSTSNVKIRLAIPDNKFNILSTIGSEAVSLESNRTNTAGRPINFIVVGRLTRIKAVEVAIRAFHRIQVDLPQSAKLTVIGDGILKSDLEQLIDTLDLKDAITFKGWLSQEKVHQEYLNASALVFPSFEGGGAVVGEALSYGVPVILNEFSGASALFEAEYKYFIKDYKVLDDYIKEVSMKMLDIAHMPEGNGALLRDYTRSLFGKKIDWNAKGEELKLIYDKL